MALWSSLDHPPSPTYPQLSFIFQWCAVSPSQLFPSLIRYVRFPPLSLYILSVRCPPHLPDLALSWILSKVVNLASSSLQDEATDCFLFCVLLSPSWIFVVYLSHLWSGIVVTYIHVIFFSFSLTFFEVGCMGNFLINQKIKTIKQFDSYDSFSMKMKVSVKLTKWW